MINIIAALDENNGLGKNNNIPWNCPQDLAAFNKLTFNGVVIMGRNTWNSLKEPIRPLKDRDNFVVSQNRLDIFSSIMRFGFKNELEVYVTPQAALEAAKKTGKTVWIIGGGQIYKELISEADYLYLSHIPGDYKCDVFFPEYKNRFEIMGKIVYDTYTFTLHKRR